MIEFRAIPTSNMDKNVVQVFSKGIGIPCKLQYRVLKYRVDASGALNVMPPEWSDWFDVEIDSE